VENYTQMSCFYPEYDATFIHIPKCGGTFIENAMSKITEQIPAQTTPLVGRHSTYFQITKKGSKIFTQVREPVGWYLSYYRFCKYKKITLWEPKVWHPTDILDSCDWSEFNQWVFSVQKLRPSFLTRMYEAFIGDERMKTGIKIYRLEDMPESIKKIFEYLNINKKVPEMLESEYNKSEYEMPEVKCDTITLIKEREKNIYERFYTQ